MSETSDPTPQAPIARVTVNAVGEASVEILAPGLPLGIYDLYCEPEAVAPYLRQKILVP